MENEFYRYYKERVMPALQKLHGYENVHQVPKVEKVVINTSVGSQSDVKQALEEAKAELALTLNASSKPRYRASAIFAASLRAVLITRATIRWGFRINRFFQRSSWIKSSAISDLMLQSSPRHEPMRKPNRC